VKAADGLGFVVFLDGEVFLLEVVYRVSLVVGDGDVEDDLPGDDLDGGRRGVAVFCGLGMGGKGEGQGEQDRLGESHHHSPQSSGAGPLLQMARGEAMDCVNRAAAERANEEAPTRSLLVDKVCGYNDVRG
jgi:hypothetical protein